MTQTRVDLGIEELAFAMGVLGGNEAAHAFLMSVLGQKEKRDMEQRLLASAHSLVARGYLEFDLGTAEKRLSMPLVEALDAMMNYDRLVRCNRMVRDGEKVMTFFIRDGRFLETALFKEVAMSLEWLAGSDEAVERCVAFLGMTDATKDSGSTAALGTLPSNFMERIRGSGQTKPSSVASQLQAWGLAPQVAKRLAEDLVHEEWRGSVIAVAGNQDEPASNGGFLVLHGARQGWVLQMSADDPTILEVYPGTAERVAGCLRDLMREI